MLPAQIGTEGVKMTRTVTRLQGSLMVLASGVMFSFGALTFRALVEADAWQYLFYRGLSAGLVAALVIVMVGRNPIRSVAEAGARQIVAGLVLGAMFTLFIVALSRVTAAFILLLQVTSPFFAALMGRIFLRESVSRDTVIAMLVAAVGVGIMVGAGFGTGDALGILLALVLPMFLGGYTVLIRSSPIRDPGVPTIVGGLAVAVAAGAVSLAGPGLVLPLRDVAMGFIGGGVLVGAATPIFNYAHRFVPPADTALLLISEIVLAPLWLWIWPGEVPTTSTLVGGGVALAAVIWLTVRTAGPKGSLRLRRAVGLHAGAVPVDPGSVGR
jgi:drug/metabolite transporter (DMT)-like permease|tara:strand:+ start:4672 stop:5652 length:981 start_codon:yes stop_codon:yes gene_type:complete